MKSKLLIFILTCCCMGLFAQQMIVISPKETQKAEKLYNSGLEKFNKQSYDAAIKDLKESIKTNANLTEAYKLLAKAYQQNNSVE